MICPKHLPLPEHAVASKALHGRLAQPVPLECREAHVSVVDIRQTDAVGSARSHCMRTFEPQC